MRLLEILVLQKSFIRSRTLADQYYTYDDVLVKAYTGQNRTYIALFVSDYYACSLEIKKGRIFWNTYKDVIKDIEIEESDLSEDESFLTLKYGKHFGKDVLDKITISMDRLEEIVLNSIQHYNQGDDE